MNSLFLLFSITDDIGTIDQYLIIVCCCSMGVYFLCNIISLDNVLTFLCIHDYEFNKNITYYAVIAIVLVCLLFVIMGLPFVYSNYIIIII